MSGKPSNEYWDTCVFLAYLWRDDEDHRNGEPQEIQSKIESFENGKINLLTSTITITEIYEAARLNEKERLELQGIFNRSNFQFIEATRQVCYLASEIRSYFKNNPVKENLYPTTPDAIQVASAIAVSTQVSEPLHLITLDSNNKPKNNELAFTEMAPYIKDKYGVIITRPILPPLFSASLLQDEK